MDRRDTPAGHRALRRGRHSIAGALYFVTFVCAHRVARFKDALVAAAVAETLDTPMLWGRAEPLAWVLMPDHCHLLVKLGDDRSLGRLMQRVKSTTSRNARLAEPDEPSSWSAGYHDRALRAEDDIAQAALYLLQNPVRAGLVQRVGDYPYLSCVWGRESFHPW